MINVLVVIRIELFLVLPAFAMWLNIFKIPIPMSAQLAMITSQTVKIVRLLNFVVHAKQDFTLIIFQWHNKRVLHVIIPAWLAILIGLNAIHVILEIILEFWMQQALYVIVKVWATFNLMGISSVSFAQIILIIAWCVQTNHIVLVVIVDFLLIQ